MTPRSMDPLYHATAEDFAFGVGLLALPDVEPAPLIQLHYPGWSRAQLVLVCQVLRRGLSLIISEPAHNHCDLHLSSVERAALKARCGDHTSVLRAPAWDAHLPGIDSDVIRQFQVNREPIGGYLLLLQTPAVECLLAINDPTGAVMLGSIRPRSFAVPTD